jgi:Tfp pilus assembly protein PilN
MKSTINLLPPAKKQEMQGAFVLAHVQSVVIVVLLLSLIVVGTLVGVRFMLASTHASLTNRAEPALDGGYESVSDNIQEVNGVIARFDELTAGRTAWSAVTDSIMAMVPDGVVLQRFSLDDGKITIVGKGAARGDVLALRDRLIATPYLTDVESPLTNILRPTDVQFEFRMTYLPPDAAPPDEAPAPADGEPNE